MDYLPNEICLVYYNNNYYLTKIISSMTFFHLYSIIKMLILPNII